MKQDLKSRIQRMYMQDCAMAYLDALMLWACIIFVLISILSIVEDSNIRLVMYSASALLLLFNTASVLAMTKHFSEDKQFIYGLDIKHLDQNRSIANNMVATSLPVNK
jgi:hypothetical protein